jgi:hypothetical protein
MSAGPRPAPHVQAALARHGHRAVQPRLATEPAAPATTPSPGPPTPGQHLRDAVRPHRHPFAQPVALVPAGGQAPHVATALARRDAAPPRPEAASELAGEFVAYEDRKNRGGPVPPPKRPVHALRCKGDGSGCVLVSVETGRVRQADTLYAGFVRMTRDGDVYVAERQAVDMPGDSHPSIASATPEGRAGKKTIVAAGEVGIRNGDIVGHNDKTGHYQTRKNKQQSGLPGDKFHPFTENPKEWFSAPRSQRAEPPAGPAPESGTAAASGER